MQAEPKKQDQPKPQLHPYVQELLRLRAQDQQSQPPATTTKEIYHRKRRLQLARAIR
jgi:predicted HD phosphohydrolase